MTTPTGESSISETQSHIAWQWYDFTCPFCYIGQSRNKVLEQNGFKSIALPFQAHPEVPHFLKTEAVKAFTPLKVL